MTHPEDGAGPTPDALAQRWQRAVSSAGLVPDRKAKTRQALRALLQQLLDALLAEPFDPEPGWWVGERLVDLRMADPRVLGATVRLLYAQLPKLTTGEPSVIRQRLGLLMEQLVSGFGLAARRAATLAGEDLNRNMAIAWQSDKQKMRDTMQRARLYDAVSGLPNRTFVRERLGLHLQGERPDLRIGACLLRINNFADLADTIGHQHGDQVLRGIAP